MLKNYLLLLFFISFSSLAYSFKWQRGSYQIDQIDPAIQFSKYGELATELTAEKLPLEFSQLAKFSADDSAKLFFRISTGVLGKWEGPGKFSIEAFDHSWVKTGLSNESMDELTRTILYFDKGLLFINAEAIEKESSIRIETPLGKVITHDAIFSIKLEEFEDSAHKNAIIKCYQGSLVYTDRVGNTYALSDGNKMSIILKDDLFKVNIVELDDLEKRAIGNFNKERINFIEASAYPKVKMPAQTDSAKSDESEATSEEIQKYYYFPVVEQIKSFNPYKKSYSDD